MTLLTAFREHLKRCRIAQQLAIGSMTDLTPQNKKILDLSIKRQNSSTTHKSTLIYLILGQKIWHHLETLGFLQIENVLCR